MTIQHSSRATARADDPAPTELVHDESAWPHVTITWPSDFGDADLQIHLGRLKDYLSRGPFVLLYDVTAARALTSVERQEFVSFFKANDEVLEANCRGVAYISHHKVHRGILTAIQWFVTMPFPLRMFPNRDDGLRWLQTLEPDRS